MKTTDYLPLLSTIKALFNDLEQNDKQRRWLICWAKQTHMLTLQQQGQAIAENLIIKLQTELPQLLSIIVMLNQVKANKAQLDKLYDEVESYYPQINQIEGALTNGQLQQQWQQRWQQEENPSPCKPFPQQDYFADLLGNQDCGQ